MVFNQMLEWVSGSNWSYVAVFAVAVIDAFFPVVPSESMVILAGALAGAGDLNVFLVIVAAWAGAVIGDNISYGIGKFVGERTVKRLFNAREGAQGLRLGRATARANGAATSSWSRASSPSDGTAVTFTAGYTKGLPWHRFFRYDLIAGGVWATYATMLGYIGGKQFEEQPWKGVLLGLGDRVHRGLRDRVRARPPREAEPACARTARPVRPGRVRLHVTGATGLSRLRADPARAGCDRSSASRSGTLPPCWTCSSACVRTS